MLLQKNGEHKLQVCKNLSIVVTTINSNNSYECNNHENRKI